MEWKGNKNNPRPTDPEQRAIYDVRFARDVAQCVFWSSVMAIIGLFLSYLAIPYDILALIIRILIFAVALPSFIAVKLTIKSLKNLTP